MHRIRLMKMMTLRFQIPLIKVTVIVAIEDTVVVEVLATTVWDEATFEEDGAFLRIVAVIIVNVTRVRVSIPIGWDVF